MDQENNNASYLDLKQPTGDRYQVLFIIDPLGRPHSPFIFIFTGVVRPHFRTSVPLFKISQKQMFENNDRYWWGCGTGRGDHWWHTCLVIFLFWAGRKNPNRFPRFASEKMSLKCETKNKQDRSRQWSTRPNHTVAHSTDLLICQM